MTIPASHRSPVRLHLTNVTGAGATQLLQSLLPALERDPKVIVESIELPNRGNLAEYQCVNPTTVAKVYNRYLPNALSRLLECTLFSRRFDGKSPLLVLGDLPLRCNALQTVFLHQTNLLQPFWANLRPSRLKYAVGQVIFKLNLNRVSSFIVQTEVVRDALERCYPGVSNRTHVIAQPVPSWLLQSGLRRKARARASGQALNLIYPAAGYPHKNHTLLSHLDPSVNWPVEQLVLTLDAVAHPAPGLSWVHCGGFLSPAAMIAAYSQYDALLFLSKAESYGFPLVEAMFVGLPIVCPDLPYAHTLCGDQAFYFNPDQPESLRQALLALQSRLDQGWWPNWQDQLINIPSDWDIVARKILEVACGSIV